MKKTLFILSVSLSGVMFAQNAPVNSRVSRIPTLKPSLATESTANTKPNTVRQTNKQIKHAKKVTSSATYVYVGTAYNMLGVITAACTQVDANQSLNMVSFTHRESAALNFSSGAYQTDYSLDGGSTWDTAKAVVFKGAANAANGSRYPNGVILNPAGNTTPSSAYAITAGPHTNGSAWDSVVMGSIRLDSMYTNQQEELMFPNSATYNGFTAFSPQHYMSVSNDSVIHSIQDGWTYNSALTADQGWYGAVINKGVWNGATHSVTWTNTVLRPHFNSVFGSTSPFDSGADVDQVATAWSQDGSVGYVVFWGNLDSTNYNFVSDQPVIYKSIDHGNTWNMMPLFNFRDIPNLVQYIKPTIDSPSVKIPTWDINGDSAFYPGHDVDVTVDMNNNLHIFGAIEPCAIANPDSSGYIYNPSLSGGRYIYDVYTTSSTGGWQARFLDSLNAPLGASSTVTNWSSTADGPITWGARIQATRSTDGSKIFCSWLDDFTQPSDVQIEFPDMVSIGINLTTNQVTAPVRVTNTQNIFFLQVSDIALPSVNSGDTCWTIPAVYVVDPAAPDEGLTPIEFWYIQGPSFCNDAWNASSTPKIVDAAADFTVSPNYPNPFSNITYFNVNLTKESVVSVDVYNLLGEKVTSINAQKMSSGTHLMTINGNGWNSGVYFYRVTVNDQSITQKMMVK